MKIDIFTHILPKRYQEKIMQIDPVVKDINKRVRDATGIMDLDDRFRVMDHFGDYAQIINIVTPLVESYGPPSVSVELARIANDGMAELVRSIPTVSWFAAALPMRPEATLARPSVKELGAVGVQVMSNVLGRPLDKPETMPLFDLMANSTAPSGFTRFAVWTFRITGRNRRVTTRSGGTLAGRTRRAQPWHISYFRASSTVTPTSRSSPTTWEALSVRGGKISRGWDALGTDNGRRLFTRFETAQKNRLITSRMFYADQRSSEQNVATCGLSTRDEHVLFRGSDMPPDQRTWLARRSSKASTAWISP
jgi:hypothetical protein